MIWKLVVKVLESFEDLSAQNNWAVSDVSELTFADTE